MDAMSDAIEGADVMLYGVSLRYKESANVSDKPSHPPSDLLLCALLMSSVIATRLSLGLSVVCLAVFCSVEWCAERAARWTCTQRGPAQLEPAQLDQTTQLPNHAR
jgi:hypothetical protein